MGGRFINADLLDNVVTIYDQTKTYIAGRCFSKTVGGKTALGPPLNKFVDIQTLAGITPEPNANVCSAFGRMVTIQAEAGGLSVISLFTKNFATGAMTYIGKIQVNLPDVAATTTTKRSVKLYDNAGTTGWKLAITTSASPLINGGPIIVNNLDLADFVPTGFPTIPFATGNNQKAVYFYQDPSNVGVNNAIQAAAGTIMDRTAGRLYVHNGVSATHQYHIFDLNTAPTYTTAAITGTELTNIINHTGHTFNNNDPIVFLNLTGGAGLTANTVYFVRNAVAGVSYEVSATSGGASINFTTDITAGTVGRAFGTSTNSFITKTGNLTALTGVLLLTDSEDFAQPVSTGFAQVDGFDCAFFATSTNLYLGRLSELTAGATTWPSLVSVNLLGSPNQIVNPVATYAAWSNVLQKAVYSVGQIFVMKSFANNSIDKIFGGANNRYFEGITTEIVEFQPFTAITSMDIEDGYLFITNASVGQRGVMILDLRSDEMFDYSYIITKVLDTPQAVLNFITTIDSIYNFTGSLKVYYRTSGFGTASGGWIEIPFAEILSVFAAGLQTQFKIAFDTLGLDTSIHAQLIDFKLGYESLVDNSDYWELSVDDSDNGNPSRVAFRLKKAYPSVVPALRFQALDLSNSQVVNHTTTANPTRFSYSTDDGVTWNTGTTPNVVGTLQRYEFATPPGVDIRPSLKEA